MFFPKLITDQLFTIVYKKIKAQNTLEPDIILPGQPYQSVISADITYLKVSYSAMNYTCVKVNLRVPELGQIFEYAIWFNSISTNTYTIHSSLAPRLLTDCKL